MNLTIGLENGSKELINTIQCHELDSGLVLSAYESVKDHAGWRFVAMHGHHYHWNLPTANLRSNSSDIEWLHSCPQPIVDLVTAVKLSYADFRINRVVINGQTQGMDSGIHRDSIHADAVTLLVYLNSEWSNKWGGGTRFFQNSESGLLLSYEQPFLPQKMVSYPSCYYHQGLGPLISDKLRITMSIQLVSAKYTNQTD